MRAKKIYWWLVFSLSALPSLYFGLIYVLNPRQLGIDPVEVLLAESGQWAFRFLLITLLCSPLRRLKLRFLSRYRRMLGLFSFYYASMHAVIYVVAWIELDWPIFIQDLVSRPFIYVGMFAWLVLLVLAATSPKAVVKALKKRWVILHRLIYIAALAVMVHLWMQTRGAIGEVLLYGCVLFLLLAERLYRAVPLLNRQPVGKSANN